MALLDDIRSDPKYYLSRLILLTLGGLLSAAAVVIFLLPLDIAPAGVSGLAVILNRLIGTPIGLMVLIANIPIQIVAFRVLKGWKTIAFTVYSIVLYSLALDVMQSVLPGEPLTDDGFLSAVVGGVIGGLGAGLIYRAGGTVGGTSSIAQMIRQRYGMSLSTATLFADSLVIVLAGFVLSWEAALYAFITVFINRLASDYVLEGPSNTCSALIVTDHADTVREALTENLRHGVASWTVNGSQPAQQHKIVLVSLLRSEVHALQHLIRRVDDDALVTVLTGQVVYGDGFQSMHARMPLRLDEVD